MLPKLDEPHLAALRELHGELSSSPIRWVLTGSAGFALQGVPVAVHDLDVQTDAAGAYEIAQRFARSSSRSTSGIPARCARTLERSSSPVSAWR
jgi:hypothetical protein